MAEGNSPKPRTVDISIMIAGKAGQGMQTIGAALCRVVTRCGLHVFSYQDNMSRIRGGNNFYQLRISDQPVGASKIGIQILLCLDAESLSLYRNRVVNNGRILVDREGMAINEVDDKIRDIPFRSILNETGSPKHMMSAIGLGLFAGMLGIEFGEIEKILNEIFSEKGGDIVLKNIRCAQKGYTTGASAPFSKVNPIRRITEPARMLLSGNDAIAAGSIGAGCGFYSAYPMSPSTTIMETMARFATKYGIVVEQAEDEIAAINMAIGASFAGVRSMTGTSGGGFALMSEGLSLAAMTETPVVIVDGQRPAPATGFPTRTEQADLAMVINAGHGEFARVVYTPGSAEEAFRLTARAFDIAERFQIPVILLSDQYLADSQTDVASDIFQAQSNKRYILSADESKRLTAYDRYSLSQCRWGVSPRAVPSWIDGEIYAVSDEHTERGHITEDGNIRNKMVQKRYHRKMEALAEEAIEPYSFGIETAQYIVAGFGSTFGVLGEAVSTMCDSSIGFLHFSQVWPLPVRSLNSIIAARRDCVFITVENNATGQLARLIRSETGIHCSSSILKYDGRPFTVDEVIDRLQPVVHHD